MKPDQIYHELTELAEKFGIAVSEQNFKTTSVKAKSGFCIVKGEKRFIVDKHLKVSAKINVLASFINQLPHEDIYIIPALREVLERSG
jgi:hypothetical protein